MRKPGLSTIVRVSVAPLLIICMQLTACIPDQPLTRVSASKADVAKVTQRGKAAGWSKNCRHAKAVSAGLYEHMIGVKYVAPASTGKRDLAL
jgi:hypothetical protein